MRTAKFVYWTNVSNILRSDKMLSVLYQASWCQKVYIAVFFSISLAIHAISKVNKSYGISLRLNSWSHLVELFYIILILIKNCWFIFSYSLKNKLIEQVLLHTRGTWLQQILWNWKDGGRTWNTLSISPWIWCFGFNDKCNSWTLWLYGLSKHSPWRWIQKPKLPNIRGIPN